MEKRLQHRLIGAGAIIALAVIFLPMLLTGNGDKGQVSLKMKIPPQPTYHFNKSIPAPETAIPPEVSALRVLPVPTTLRSAPSAASVQAPAPAGNHSPTAPIRTSSPKVTSTRVKVFAATSPVTRKSPVPAAAQELPLTIKPQAQHKPSITQTSQVPASPTSARIATQKTHQSTRLIGRWSIQVASFILKPAAKVFRDQIRKRGFSAYIERFDDLARKRIYYRVRIGPIPSRSQAEQQLSRVDRIFKIKAFAVPYP